MKDQDQQKRFKTTAAFSLFLLILVGVPVIGILVPDIMINHDVPGAHVSSSPDVVCEGDTAYSVWEDRRNGGKDIYFNASPDGGRTWMNSDIRLDVGTAPGTSASLTPRLAASGESVYVVWQDNRRKKNPNDDNDFFAGDIYLNYSLNRGVTWQSVDFRVNRTAGRGHTNPRIAVSGNTVYVVWEKQFGSHSVTNADLLVNISHDKGITWQPADTRLDDPFAGLDHNTHRPAIAAADDSIYIAWQESDHISYLGEIYVVRSMDLGQTWGPRKKIRSDALEWFNAERPQLAALGSTVHLAWLDARDGAENVYYTRSLDGGASWESAEKRLNTGSAAGAAYCYEPRVSISGSNVCVVWRDNRNDPNQDEYWYNNRDDIYSNTSADGGKTWLDEDSRVNIGDSPGDHHAAAPAPVMAGEKAFIVWKDWRNGQSDVYVNLVQRGGCGTPVRLDTGDAPGASESNIPETAVTSTDVHVVWVDFRNNALAGDIYYNRLSMTELPLRLEGEKVLDRSLLMARNLVSLTIRIDPDWLSGQNVNKIQVRRRAAGAGSTWTTIRDFNPAGASSLKLYDVIPSAGSPFIYQAVAVETSGGDIACSNHLQVT